MTRKIVLDTDPGIDDAFAIALALAEPDLDVLALTATGGNISGERATRNVQTIVEQLDPPKRPRLGEALRSETAHWKSAEHLHGPGGLGGLTFPFASLHHMHPSDKTIVDLVRTFPHEITLVAVGPLTNIARAFELDPELPVLLDRLVIMGGSVHAGGNVTAAAEFNFYCDPRAARAVVRSTVPKLIVPLDVTHQVVFTETHQERLPDKDTPAGRLLRAILPYAFEAHRKHCHLNGTFLHDAVAVTAVVYPELIRTRPMAVDVEVSGELTRGTLVCDTRRPPREPNADVALEVDADAVIEYWLQALNRSATRHADG